MTDSQTEEQKILLAAKKVANSAAFPGERGQRMGMNYEQYLIGQALAAIDPYNKDFKDIHQMVVNENIATRAIGIASTTIIELAKQQMRNEDG